MYIIGIYDINTEDAKGRRRIHKILKLFRRYLHHVQKSAFEGETTESKYLALKTEAEKIIDKDKDMVLFFKMNNPCWLEKEFLGLQEDVTNNII